MQVNKEICVFYRIILLRMFFFMYSRNLNQFNLFSKKLFKNYQLDLVVE